MTSTTTRRTAICIISHNAYGAMRGGSSGHVGGAEHQTAMLARWLANRGHDVSFLTWDEGQPAEEMIDGVRVIKMCDGDEGVPGLRFIHPRTTSLFSAMRRANADVYYHNAAESVTGLAADWCRRHHRPFVYTVASDVACEWKLPDMKGVRHRMFYRHGLRHATRVIAQTRRQKELLATHFGVDAVHLPMPCRLAPANSISNGPERSKRVAWVGRIDPVKRMEWILDIAERTPDLVFDIVGANMETALRNPHLARYATDLHARVQAIPNVVWHGGLPRDEVPAVYRAAFCLCCTSVYEGFPNTFLEAWSQGTPVITTFDPDGLIQNRNLGAFATDVDDLVSALRRVHESAETRKGMARNSIDYYSGTHALEVAMPPFEREILDTLSSPRRGIRSS